MGFADRYLNRMSEALDTAAMSHPTPQCRVAAQATKYYPGITVVTVACEPDPSVALLDMLVVVTLERLVWEGSWSKEIFGDEAAEVMRAQREVEADIWNVAGSVMSPAQLKEIRTLIEEWRANNPSRRYVSSMRFDDIVSLRQDRAVAPIQFDMLAPVTEAARTVEEARILGERTLFLAARMPILLHWQMELLLQEATARPEFQQLVADANSFASSTKELTEIASQWPDEAQKLSDNLGKLTRDSKPIIDDARQIVDSVHRTLEAADKLAARMETWSAEPVAGTDIARPFDIREYRETAMQLTETLRELNRAIAQTETSVSSPGADAFMKRVDEIMVRRVEHAGDQARTAISQLFWTGAGLIGLAFAAALGAIYIYRRSTR